MQRKKMIQLEHAKEIFLLECDKQEQEIEEEYLANKKKIQEKRANISDDILLNIQI